jgi:hypothetical protein
MIFLINTSSVHFYTKSGSTKIRDNIIIPSFPLHSLEIKRCSRIKPLVLLVSVFIYAGQDTRPWIHNTFTKRFKIQAGAKLHTSILKVETQAPLFHNLNYVNQQHIEKGWEIGASARAYGTPLASPLYGVFDCIWISAWDTSHACLCTIRLHGTLLSFSFM